MIMTTREFEKQMSLARINSTSDEEFEKKRIDVLQWAIEEILKRID